jgi:pentapeptide MXKDX repeat protein
MDSKGRMAAIDSMKSATGLMPAGDKMATDKMATDKMATDKMASDKMAADKMAGDKMASDKMAGGTMSTDDLTKKVASYCQSNPDKMVKDGI